MVLRSLLTSTTGNFSLFHSQRKVKNKLQQPVTRQESAVLLRVSVGPQEDRDSGV